MKSSQEISDLIQEHRDELDAIVAVSEREDRDLNEDEQKRCDEISNQTIPRLQKQYKTALAVEKERLSRQKERFERQMAANHEENGTTTGGSAALPDSKKFSALKVPATARRHGVLQAFKGETAEKDAFIAGHFVLASFFGKQRSLEFCAQYGLNVQGSMYTGDNSKGGFVVPDEMSQALIRLREERGVFPRYANRIPMGSDIIRIPRLLADVSAYWVGEKQEITESDATLGVAELMARKLGALTKVSTELDEDAIVEIGDMVTASMAYAMADKIDEAAFNGDGTSTYGGVLGLKNALNSNAIQDAAGGNTGALTLDLADFEATAGLLPQYPGMSPRWYMHSAVYWASVARLQDAAGGNTISDLGSGPVRQFLGYPVEFVQVMPSTTGASASTILAYFGDLRLGAAYGVRRSIRTEVSVDRYFEEDMIGIKTTERIAINIHERGDTIRNRPIVALKTASG